MIEGLFIVNVYLSQVINGIGIGMLYFLLAVGLSIVFGLLRFVNFAHGAFYSLGAYAAYQLVAHGVSFWGALVVAPILVGLFSWLIERGLLRKMYKLPHGFHILFTLGLAWVIQEAVILYWGPVGFNVAPPDALSGVVMWGPFIYPVYRLFLIGFTAVLALALWLLLERTRLGSAIRAGSENSEMVSLLRIDVYKVFGWAFALGATTAGLAGVLAAPLRGVEPFMGWEALIIAFVVVVIGGLGSFSGALLGGLIVGVLQSVMSTLWPEGAGMMIYVAMVLVLLARPDGLMGRAQ